MTEDPFARLRDLVRARDNATHEFVKEILALRALGFSVGAIAGAVGMAHERVSRLA